MYVAVGERGVFVYDKDTGVVKAQRNEDDSLGSFITLPGLLARDITGIDVVDMIVLTANDNVYLLSPDQKAILRSTAVYGDRYSMLNKYVENQHLRMLRIYMETLVCMYLLKEKKEFLDIYGAQLNRNRFFLNLE